VSAPPRFTYDPVLHRYRNGSTGRFVSAETVHGWVVDYSANLGKSLRDLTQQLRAGSVTLAEWQLTMAQSVKDAHIAAAIAAKGGRAQMTQADWGRVGQILRQEYGYLGRLADGIADGSIPLDGRVLARAEQYGKAARETYANIWRRETQRRGADEERNVRGKRDSCEAGSDRPGCIEETARGWVSIGSLSLPGARTCLGNCGCRIETRNSVTGQVFG
jgi:hypothetical protein